MYISSSDPTSLPYPIHYYCYFTPPKIDNKITNHEIYLSIVKVKVKVTQFPVQAWTGPVDSRSLRFPDLKDNLQML